MLRYLSTLLIWWVRLFMIIANDVAATILIERNQALVVHSIHNIDSCFAFSFALWRLLELNLELLNQLDLLAKLSFPLLELLAMLVTQVLSFHVYNSGVYFHALCFLHFSLSSSALRTSFQEVSSLSIGSWTEKMHQHSEVEYLLLILIEALKAAAIWGSSAISKFRFWAISSLRFRMNLFTKSLIGWPMRV